MGGYGQVWRSSLSRTGGEPQLEVAVKRIHLRPSDAPSKRRLLRVRRLHFVFQADLIDSLVPQHLLREVVPWHDLDHPNITPFIGYTFDGTSAQLISQWESRGNLRQNMPKSPSDGLCIVRAWDPSRCFLFLMLEFAALGSSGV